MRKNTKGRHCIRRGAADKWEGDFRKRGALKSESADRQRGAKWAGACDFQRLRCFRFRRNRRGTAVSKTPMDPGSGTNSGERLNPEPVNPASAAARLNGLVWFQLLAITIMSPAFTMPSALTSPWAISIVEIPLLMPDLFQLLETT